MRMDAANKPKVYLLDWSVQATYTGSSPVSYRYKTKNTKQISSWYDIYVQLITDLMSEYPKRIKHGISVGGRRSFDICDATKKHNMRRPQNIGSGLVLETFGTPAILIDRMYHFLTLCKVDPSKIVIKFDFDDKQRESEYLEQRPGQNVQSYSRANVDRKVARRCKSILRKQFENGFRLKSSIDMNRLRESYQKAYKEELPTDEKIIAILHSINKPMDGRIYADRSEEQDDLIEVILQDMKDTELHSALQQIMENRKYNAPDGHEVKVDAGIVFLGNISGSAMDEYSNMFLELPEPFHRVPFLDRIHGFIKGWELPRMNDDLKAFGWALNSEYFSSIMHELRDDPSYRAIVDARIDMPPK